MKINGIFQACGKIINLIKENMMCKYEVTLECVIVQEQKENKNSSRRPSQHPCIFSKIFYKKMFQIFWQNLMFASFSLIPLKNVLFIFLMFPLQQVNFQVSQNVEVHIIQVLTFINYPNQFSASKHSPKIYTQIYKMPVFKIFVYKPLLVKIVV